MDRKDGLYPADYEGHRADVAEPASTSVIIALLREDWRHKARTNLRLMGLEAVN